MGATVEQILAVVEEQAPAVLAYSWDRVGLQIGSSRQEVTKLVVALEATEAVLQGAVAAGAELVLCHHPLLFQPLSRFCPDKPLERIVAYAIKHDLAVAAAHTNLDAAQNGLNAYLARVLGLIRVEPLDTTHTETLLKLAVFVPVGYEDRVRRAICAVGGGVIGKYSHCSFLTRGQGTYLPDEGARPWAGVAGSLHRAAESRLEILVPAGVAGAAIRRLREVHPYEEVAYDLYPLQNPGLRLGVGRVGDWPQPRPFDEVVVLLKEIFGVASLKVTGRMPGHVQRVAVCGGSGGELIAQARHKGADIFMTGDIRYHQAVAWAQEPMAILDLGHYATEVLFIREWGRQLAEGLQVAAMPVEVIVDRWGQDPFSHV